MRVPKFLSFLKQKEKIISAQPSIPEMSIEDLYDVLAYHRDNHRIGAVALWLAKENAYSQIRKKHPLLLEELVYSALASLPKCEVLRLIGISGKGYQESRCTLKQLALLDLLFRKKGTPQWHQRYVLWNIVLDPFVLTLQGIEANKPCLLGLHRKLNAPPVPL